MGEQQTSSNQWVRSHLTLKPDKPELHCKTKNYNQTESKTCKGLKTSTRLRDYCFFFLNSIIEVIIIWARPLRVQGPFNVKILELSVKIPVT